MNSAVTCNHVLIVGLKMDGQMNMNSSRYRDNLQCIATGINLQCVTTVHLLQGHLQCNATVLDLVYPFSIQRPAAHVTALFTGDMPTACHWISVPWTEEWDTVHFALRLEELDTIPDGTGKSKTVYNVWKTNIVRSSRRPYLRRRLVCTQPVSLYWIRKHGIRGSVLYQHG
jgi:hypothetical protein